MKLPKRLDHAIAKRYPNLYTLLWYWKLVRNEP